MTRDVAVVPHTHWDREWYEAYQTFRLKLVDLVDGLLPILENDPGPDHAGPTAPTGSDLDRGQLVEHDTEILQRAT